MTEKSEDTIHFAEEYEDIGIPGKNSLRQTLTAALASGQSISSTIVDFQNENGIILPSLRPMLPLLYLLGVRGKEFHQSVVDELREKLVKRIEEIATKMDPAKRDIIFKDLLHKSFPLIKNPMLQPVVMSLLKHVEVVDDKYLKLLVANEQLYNKCDVSVKRHIWQEHQSLLINEVSPLLFKYIKEKEAIFANIKDPGRTFFSLTPKVRRQNEVLQTLAKMVGRNVLLYDTILQFLRTVFLHTQNTHYCTLRVSLLMELHDANITDITSMDPCHKFAWCLDACIREQNVDPKRARELQGFLEGIRKGQEQVLGDLAMALADPYAVNFISHSIIRILYNQISNEALPRDHNVLHFLLRLLNLGLHAYEILNKQAFREPKLDPTIVTRFIPILMSFIVDDQVRAVNSKLPPDDRESALTIIEHCGPPPDDFQNYVNTDPLAAVLAIYYSANTARQRDRQAVSRVFGTLTAAHEGMCFADQYLHILVSGLVNMGEELANEELCSLIFDEIFLPALGHSSTVLHLMKLVYHVHSWLPPARLHTLITTIQSFVTLPDTKDIIQTSFVELKERIEKKAQEAQTPSTTASGNASSTSSTTTTAASSSTMGNASLANESMRHMISPSTPAYMSPSPAMSPYYHGQSVPHPPLSPVPPSFSPTHSPMPYQSPFHHPTMHPTGPSSSAGSNSHHHHQTY